MSLFDLKTCTPLKGTPWSTAWVRKSPQNVEGIGPISRRRKTRRILWYLWALAVIWACFGVDLGFFGGSRLICGKDQVVWAEFGDFPWPCFSHAPWKRGSRWHKGIAKARPLCEALAQIGSAEQPELQQRAAASRQSRVKATKRDPITFHYPCHKHDYMQPLFFCFGEFVFWRLKLQSRFYILSRIDSPEPWDHLRKTLVVIPSWTKRYMHDRSFLELINVNITC